MIKLLIIDDSPADVNIILEILNDTDCSFTTKILADGNEAIKFLKKEHPYEDEEIPHLIILDLNLPGKSGFDILKELQNREIPIPVIVYTTSDSPRDIRAAYRLRASCYVVKPPEFDQLNHVLRLIASFWMRTVQLPQGD